MPPGFRRSSSPSDSRLASGNNGIGIYGGDSGNRTYLFVDPRQPIDAFLGSSVAAINQFLTDTWNSGYQITVANLLPLLSGNSGSLAIANADGGLELVA